MIWEKNYSYASVNSDERDTKNYSLSTAQRRILFVFVIIISSVLLVAPIHASNAKLPNGAGGALSLNQPIVGMSAVPNGQGYWLVASDGGIFTFGNANFYGSAGGISLNQPIVGMSAVPNGQGYWLVARDGGIFTYGNANFHGSTGAMSLNQPIVGMSTTPSGNGYWLVARDGGIFTFGDANFYGSTGAMSLNQPIVGMASTPSGNGYWLVASDGGIFTFGDANFYGSTGSMRLLRPIVGISPTTNGGGYWLAAADGGVFSFGNADFFGSTGGGCLGSSTIAMSSHYGFTGYFTATANGQARAFSPTSKVTCSGTQNTGSSSSSANENAIAQDMLARVNAERAARGLSALAWSPSLASNARSWSVSMSGSNNFAHSNLNPLLQQYHTAAENIGLGGAGTRSGQLHNAWMNSTGHRVNLLARNLDVIGIGVYCAPDGRMWSTQQFGRYPNSSLPSGFGSTPPLNPIVRGDGAGPTC